MQRALDVRDERIKALEAEVARLKAEPQSVLITAEIMREIAERQYSKLPVAVGFGVRTPEQAAVFGRISDGVVVGSALVEEVRAAVEQGDPGSSVKRISVVAKTLSNAIVMARSDRSVH